MSTWSACGPGPVQPARAADAPLRAAVRVKLAPVEHGALARKIRASGTVQLKSEADLAFKVGGVVTRVAVDAGARVRKGQLLASVDPTELHAVQAQATHARGKAERDLLRVRALLETGAASSVDVQNAETAAAVSRASAEAADFNVRHAQLLAPDDGIVERRRVEIGEVVAPGAPVFHLRGASRGVIVRCSLSDRDALALSLGDPASVTLDARPDAPLPARVSQIASVASASTGTLELELRLDAPEAARWPSGLTAKIVFERREQPSAVVPLAALVDGAGAAAAVFVIDGERARRVPVRIAFMDGERAALASGLASAASVVASGADQLEDGALVTVMQ